MKYILFYRFYLNFQNWFKGGEMEKYIKSLKNLSLIIVSLIGLSVLTVLIKFDTVYSFFRYFEYSKESILYNYLWNIAFEPTLR